MTQKILFISTHNAARSQMAEGYLRAKYGDRYEAFSAGLQPDALDPRAVRVMAEIGIDISAQRAKSLSEYFEKQMDVVVTVCEGGICPMFPWATTIIHEEFPDPQALAGDDEEAIAGFRAVRDDLAAWIDARFGKRE
ncbi:MAG TPA: arsenate reductase ArsC [Methanofollis liminatans]|uniref:Arsenate reductase ArsC n=1 Tax=Methanofollis liminatans TaxID=2201 RepID=A0A831PT50_9EURY|nr:arsenate reductase ArsC [Methanofollis liminatans]